MAVSTRQALLQALSAAGGSYVSGQQLAETLGVSRAAVHKAAAALTAQGYALEAASRRGYRLLGGDPFCAEAVGEYDAPIYLYDKLESSNRTAKLLALEKIRMELRHAIDKHTKGLIATNIELLLDYCMRFYERQFVTRGDMNLDVLARFERLLDDYLTQGAAAKEGLPSVRYFASKICLSPNYFGDLVKKETGKSAQEYIQLKMIDAAKEGLLDPNKTIGQVAYELGFQYPQHFSRLFKKNVGCTPNEYKQQS